MFSRLRAAIQYPVTSQSHARTWMLSLKEIRRDQDKTEDSTQSDAQVRSNLSPYHRQGAALVQHVKHTGTAVVECRDQNHKCHNLKPTQMFSFTVVIMNHWCVLYLTI